MQERSGAMLIELVCPSRAKQQSVVSRGLMSID